MRWLRIAVVACLSLALFACIERVGPFSPKAYELATSLKVESLALMDKAIEPADAHAVEIGRLRMDLEKAYEYAKGRPKNDDSTRQWQVLKNPKGHSLGGFLTRWDAEKTMTSAFIAEAKGEVADSFDQIIGLESGKRKE